MKKKAAAMNTITNTIAVVTSVSLRVGQVTRANSWRTCWTNSAAVVLAISDQSTLSAGPTHNHINIGCRRWRWQEWRGSNPQPPVLETGALPIELHSFISRRRDHPRGPRLGGEASSRMAPPLAIR